MRTTLASILAVGFVVVSATSESATAKAGENAKLKGLARLGGGDIMVEQVLGLLTAGGASRLDDATDQQVDSNRDNLRVGLSLLLAENLDELKDPRTLNKAVRRLSSDAAFWRILQQANFQFKTFNESGESPALGFAYDYSEDFTLGIPANDKLTFDASLDMRGNVAFDAATNPADFFDGKASLHAFRSTGGIETSIDEAARFDALNAWEDELAEIENLEELNSSAILEAFKATHAFSTQKYWDVAANVGLEADQTFTQEQWVYGAQFGLEIRAWDPESELAGLNVFEVPFRFTRALSGYSGPFNTGATLPTVLVALEQVDPTDDDHRAIADPDEGKNTYPRFRLESSFSTRATPDVDFVADLRYYREPGPSSLIEAAELDQYMYFTSALLLPNDLYISYTWGKLPFDDKNDQIYEIGLKVKL